MPKLADPYETLGVGREATDDEIKRAYRKLARRYHPDANPDDKDAEERFKEIQNAYAILSDPEKRKSYDQGADFSGFDAQAPGGAGFGSFSDILSDLFQTGARRRPARGRDLETEVHISFEQAMHGAQVPVALTAQTSCAVCAGTGARPPTKPTVCERCKGRGIEAEGQGLFSISQPCRRCHGTGTEIKDPCAACKGSGRTRQVRRYRVNIPAGIADGARVRLAGKGEPATDSGTPGDLYVICRVGASSVFRRVGDNLEVEVPITVAEAIEGAEIEVPTLDGKKKIRVGAGTQSGELKRLRGEGPPRAGKGSRADIHYRLRVEIPSSLPSQGQQALKKLAEYLDHDPRRALFENR